MIYAPLPVGQKGAMIRLISGCGPFFALALLATAPASATTGESIANQLRAGQAVVLSGANVTGQLDLRGADVRAIFKCHVCTFTGSIDASDATFERTVDFSGSRFEGPSISAGQPSAPRRYLWSH